MDMTRIPAFLRISGGRVSSALAGTLVTSSVLAGGLQQVDQTIFGMDCAPCAYGIEQGLLKLDGVSSVRVSLNDGKATVSLAPGSRTNLEQIRTVIRNNGFTPKEAQALIEGRVVREGERTWIDAGAGGRWLLEGYAEKLEAEQESGASPANATLRIHLPETLSSPPAARVIERVR